MTQEFKTEYDGLVITNEGELLDITPFLPNTEKSELLMPKFKMIDAEYDQSETSRRISGFLKKLLLETGVGNRNQSLYNFGKFVKDLGENSIHEVERANAMLHEPLAGRDLKDLLNSLARG